MVHGKGIGSDWADTVSVGDFTRVSKFSGSLSPVKGKLDWVLFLGDETTLGLSQAILDGLDDSIVPYGAIGMGEMDCASISALQLHGLTQPLSRTAATSRSQRASQEAHCLKRILDVHHVTS